MDIENKNRLIYKYSLEYLKQITPDNIDIEKYFQGDNKNYSSLKDIFERLIISAQNYQRMPNTIKYNERKETIKKVLFGFDFDKIIELGTENIYYSFRNEFNISTTDSPKNSWYKWSSSIVSSAKFLNEFKDINDFNCFVDLFSYNLPTRTALPLLIEKKIKGVGFALACDFLKELGFLEYSKPDVHLIEVFCNIGLSSDDPIDVFEAIAKMAIDCNSDDESVTPYKIDKIVWLNCTGKFYLDNVKVPTKRELYMEFLNNKLHFVTS